MRIVRAADVPDLPAGTLMCKMLRPIVFDQLEIKGPTRHGDDGKPQGWLFRPLGDIQSENDGERFETITRMMDDPSISIPADDAWDRRLIAEGPDDRFLVYEPADVQDLVNDLTGHGE